MQLSTEALNSFKKIYFDEFKVGLTDEEANVKGLELLNFVNLIYKPIPKQNEYENYNSNTN